MLMLFAAESGWNVSKAITSCLSAVAVAMPTAATTTLSQHCAVTQVSAVNTCQQSDAVTRGDGAVTQLVTQKLTEQGQIILLNDSLAICKFLLSLASVD